MALSGGYLFVTFAGEGTQGEEVYFSLSTDGLHWKDLTRAGVYSAPGSENRASATPLSCARRKMTCFIIDCHGSLDRRRHEMGRCSQAGKPVDTGLGVPRP